jgi:branched-subunit amino acid aminotransferase/4-amino-4-deoxychorismate lyase
LEDIHCIFNGHLISIYEPAISFNNRAFRYGDALFESIRVSNGEIMFLSDHISRIKLGMTVLRMNVPAEFKTENIKEMIQVLLIKNNLKQDARVRLTVIRNEGGYYAPETNDISFLLETETVSSKGYELNQKGLWVDVYAEIRKQINKLSNIKSTNALYFVMAGLAKQSMNLDECFLINEHGNICEAISSNVFVVKNGSLFTAPLSEGCIAGVMRKQIMNIAHHHKILCFENPITVNTLMNGDEVFLTNSIKGVQWVGQFKQKYYTNKLSVFFTEKLNQLTRQQ